MAKICPNCNTQVNETAKVCSECGQELTDKSSDPAWIAAMQEEIRKARRNWRNSSLIAISGAVAVGAALLLHFIGGLMINSVMGLVIMMGILVFIGGLARNYYYNNKVRSLIRQLEEGK